MRFSSQCNDSFPVFAQREHWILVLFLHCTYVVLSLYCIFTRLSYIEAVTIFTWYSVDTAPRFFFFFFFFFLLRLCLPTTMWSCKNFCVGQTDKELNTWIKQHRQSVRTGNESIALYVYTRENNHCTDWKTASKILSCNSFLKGNIIDSAFIKKNE